MFRAELGSVFAPYGKVPGAWPSGITQSRGGTVYEQPYDAQYNTRGEVGYYHDTPLGEQKLSLLQKWQIRRFYKRLSKQQKAYRSSSPFLGEIPTDFEQAKLFNHTPVVSGWIWTTQGYMTPPWLPPNGYNQGGTPVPFQPYDGGGKKVDPTQLQYYDPRLYGRSPAWNTTTLAGVNLRDNGTPATIEGVVAEMNRHNDRVFALTLVSTTAVAISAIITVFRTLRLIKTGG